MAAATNTGAGAGAGSDAGRGGPGAAGSQPGQGKPRPNRWTGQHNFGNSQQARPGQSQPNSRTPSYSSQNAAPPAASQGPPAATSQAHIVCTPDEQARMHERMLYLLANTIGSSVNVTLRSGIVYTGIFASSSDSEHSICLKMARQIAPQVEGQPAPPKSALIVSAKDLVAIEIANVNFDTAPAPAGANRPISPTAAVSNGMQSLDGAFKTDTDISGFGQREHRELQRWGSGVASSALGGDDSIGGLEDETFGSLGGSTSGHSKSGTWDQFKVNEERFGARSDYQEEFYTTKLDKSSADFKAREARAARLAKEIESGVTSNVHIAEERGLVVEDSGLDEEDKYSGVQRGAGAYIPPGARRAMDAVAGKTSSPLAGQTATASSGTKDAAAPVAKSTTEVISPVPVDPKKANGSLAQALRTGPAQVPAVDVTTDSAKQGMPVVGAFQHFVTSEKEKFAQRTEKQKTEKQDKLNELKKWSQGFVLKTPVPADLVPILSKDEFKQQEIASRKPAPASAAASIPNATAGKASVSTSVSPNLAAPGVSQAPAAAGTLSPAQQRAAQYKVGPIPAFGSAKKAASKDASPAESTAGTPSAPSKMNANAPTFVFRPAAAAFTPGAAVAAAPVASTSAAAVPQPAAPTPATASASVTQPARPKPPVNPFFGERPPPAGQSMTRTKDQKLTHVKEDFAPFKVDKDGKPYAPEPSSIPPDWGFTGRNFRTATPHTAVRSQNNMVSPQPIPGIPAHILAPQAHLPQHSPHPSVASASSSHGARMLNIQSPPPHMSRSPSNAGGHHHDDNLSQKSSAGPTLVPAVNGSQPGAQQGHLPPAMVPQGYAMYHPQQFPQGPFRIPQGASPGQPGQPTHIQHIALPHGAPIAFSQQQGFMPGMPFSPGPMHANQPMFSPQMANQMAPAQFMSPMFIGQPGPRGQVAQMPGGPPQQIFYQHVASPGMPQHFAPMGMPQGGPAPGAQPIYEQPSQ